MDTCKERSLVVELMQVPITHSRRMDASCDLKGNRSRTEDVTRETTCKQQTLPVALRELGPRAWKEDTAVCVLQHCAYTFVTVGGRGI